jgi:hypothetical protein
MIPGAWERREGRPAAAITIDRAPDPVHAVVTAGFDRQRLEREREGGGAPSARRLIVHKSRLARLWHVISHPADVSLIWRHPLLEPR